MQLSQHHDAGLRRAATYARKSTPDDMGLDAQHLINQQKAARDGYVIPDDDAFVFEDDDTSGRMTTRDNLDRLVQLVCTGHAPFSRLYIKDKTREGRFADPRYHIFLQVLFEQHGVKICYSDRDRQVDFSGGVTPEDFGIFFKDVMEGFAASDELEKITKRVTYGMRFWAAKGFYPARHAPYGFERYYANERTGEYIGPVDETAIVRRKGERFRLRVRNDATPRYVRLIFRLVLTNSLEATAALLNKRGIPSPGGCEWRGVTVARIVSNPIYYGDFVWGRTTRPGEPETSDVAPIDGAAALLVRGFVKDAPVSRETFDRVQVILRGNAEEQGRRRRASPDYLLSGLIICAECGARWHGHTSTAAARNRRAYYRHGAEPSSYDDRCSHRGYVRAEALDDAIDGIMRKLLCDGELVAATEEALQRLLDDAAAKEREEDEQVLVAELGRKTRSLERAANDRAEAESEPERDAYSQTIKKLAREVQGLRARIEALGFSAARLKELKGRVRPLADRASRLLEFYEQGDTLSRRRVVRELIPAVRVVAPNEFVIEVQPL